MISLLTLLLALLAAGPAWADAFSSTPPATQPDGSTITISAGRLVANNTGCSTNCTFTTPTVAGGTLAFGANSSVLFPGQGNVQFASPNGTVLKIVDNAGGAAVADALQILGNTSASARVSISTTNALSDINITPGTGKSLLVALGAGRFVSGTANIGNNNNVSFSGAVTSPFLVQPGTLLGSITGTQPVIAQVSIGGDNAASTATNAPAYFGVVAAYGGTSFTSGRVGGLFQIGQNGKAVGGTFVGAEFWLFGGGGGTYDDGGQHLYGMNPQINVAPSSGTVSTPIYEAVALGEVNLAIKTGASVDRKSMVNFINLNTDVQHGNIEDVVIGMSSQLNTVSNNVVGFNDLVALGRLNGQYPGDPLGGIMRVVRQTSHTATIPDKAPVAAWGFDLSPMQITGSLLAGPNGFSANGNGSLTLAVATLAPSSSGLAIDSTGKKGTATLNAGGSGFITGDTVWGPFGDSYTVTASSGVITAITPVNGAWTTTSSPATSGSLTFGHGTGATVTYSWATATTLSLNPSGGNIVTSALPTSCSGKPTGTLWNNSSVVNVCP